VKKARVYKVQDCFEFICPERWDNLEPTDDPSIRSCSQCERNVYKATNKAKLLEFGKEGKCVAYFQYEEFLMGKVIMPVHRIEPTPPRSK